MSEKVIYRSGLSTFGLLGIVLVVLRAFKVIKWSWVLVTLPLWVGPGLIVACVLLYLLISLICFLFEHIRNIRNKRKFNKSLKAKSAMHVILFLLIAMPTMGQTVTQDNIITVTVNDMDKGAVAVVHPIVTCDTVGDVMDTVRNCKQYLFIPTEKDSSVRFYCIIAEVFGDSGYTDTIFDAFYYFDATVYDSLALHAYFYDYNQQFDFSNTNGSDALIVYPNPTRSVAVFNRVVTVPVYVYDSRGKLVTTICNAKSIDFTSLPSGMYLIRMKGYTCRVLKL